VSSSSFLVITRFEEPFVSAAVDAVASALSGTVPTSTPAILVPRPTTDVVATLRGWEHSASAASLVAGLRSTAELRACPQYGSAKRTRWLCLAAVAVPLTIIGAGRESR